MAASIQMPPCGHLCIFGHLSPLVWHWRGHSHQVTCREEWVLSDDLHCTEASQHCGCKGFAPPVPNFHSFSSLGWQTNLKLPVYFQHVQAGQEDQMEDRVCFHLHQASVELRLLQ